MPLLKRKAFEKSKASEYLRDDDEVFHCEITDEIFKDYEEYCERIILVNSMVWSCEMTGKNNLTYSEALHSEKMARRALKDFPMELRIPILFLAMKTKRCSFAEMSEDVFNFVRDRYFVGETVEACLEGDIWREAHILSVTAQKQHPDSKAIPPSSAYCYEVEQFDESDAAASGTIGTAPSDRVRRRKGVYTRDKNRLFLKQFVEGSAEGVIGIKKQAQEKYSINKVSFDQIFTGNPPAFPSSKKLLKSPPASKSQAKPGSASKGTKSAKKPSPDKKGRQESMDKFVKKTDKTEAQKNKPPADPAAKKNAQEMAEKMRKAEDLMRQRKEEERLRKKEKTARLQAYMKEWQKVKDDMELEDQRILPKGTPIEVEGIPHEHFGDFLSVLEFVHTYSEILKVKDVFHNQLDLETFRKALTSKEHAGVFSDLVQMLLTTVFSLQEDEAEEYNENGRIQLSTEDQQETDAEVGVTKAMELATKASKWSQTYLGTPLSKLPLDPTTVSEVLRLHLLSSGAGPGGRCASWRYQARGGYTSADDAGLRLRVTRPGTLRALAATHVADLPLGMLLLLSSGAGPGGRCASWRYQARGGYTSADDAGLRLRVTRPGTLRALAATHVADLPVGMLLLLSSGAGPGGRCASWRYQARGGYTSADDAGLRLRVTRPGTLRALAATHVADLPLGMLLLLSSGAGPGGRCASWRYQARGGYTSADDAGLRLRVTRPGTLRALAATHVADLPLGMLLLLSSGAGPGGRCASWRYQARGGYTSADDAGLRLRVTRPGTLRALAATHVADLPLEDKFLVLQCLMNQILSYATVRDVIEERLDELKNTKQALRLLQTNERKREAQLIAAKQELRKEAFAKKEENKLSGEKARAVDEETKAAIEKLVAEGEEKKKEYEKKLKDFQVELFDYTSYVGSDRAFRRYWVQRSLAGLFVEAGAEPRGACAHKPVTPAARRDDAQDTLAHVAKLFEQQKERGSDRAFRRYWVQRSLAGLFVEAGAEPRGACAHKPVTPAARRDDAQDTLAHVAKLFEQQKERAGSDKENESGANSRGSSPKKPLGSLNGLSHKLSGADSSAQQLRELLMCTGDVSSCLVHGKSERPRWYVYHTEEQLEALTQALNKRGLREGELRQNLELERAPLLQSLAKCPLYLLNPAAATPPPPAPSHYTRHRKFQPSLSVPPDSTLCEALELSLRDHILELEEKIFHGCLGALKVKDREAWRGTIMLRGYDKQADYLTWGPDGQYRDDYHLPHGVLKLPTDIEEEDLKSIPVNKYRDPGHYLEAPKVNGVKREPPEPGAKPEVVRGLASALLQVSQAIHHKYLKRPLGLDDKERKDREARNKSLELEALARWEVSLMESRSFSQLVLHLFTLDSSVTWSASILNASCRLCRRKTDPDNMLLCDGCNKGHHLYCLKPKLTKVPEGDWFCDQCKPKERTPRKRRKLFSDDDIEDELDNSESESLHVDAGVCGACGSGGRLAARCATCAARYHAECAQPKPQRAAKRWNCAHCLAPTRETSGRRCAAAAMSNIHHYTRALHTRNSTDSDDSEYNTALVKLKTKRSRSSKESSPLHNGSAKRGRKPKHHEHEKELNTSAQTSGRRSKNSLTNGHHEERTSKKRSSRQSPQLHAEALATLLRDVMKHKDCWPFYEPVSPEDVPDYLQVIDQPMDFTTIREKLEAGDYNTDEDLIADAALVFLNCYTYNKDSHPVAKAGNRLERFMNKRCAELELPCLPEIELEGSEVSSSKRASPASDDEAPHTKRARLD